MTLKLKLLLLFFQQKNKGYKFIFFIIAIILLPIILIFFFIIFLLIVLSSIFSIYEKEPDVYQDAIVKVSEKYMIDNQFSSKSLRCIDIFMDGGESTLEELTYILENYFIIEQTIFEEDEETGEIEEIIITRFMEKSEAESVLMKAPFYFSQEDADAVFTIPLMYGGSGIFLKPMENASVTSGYGYRSDPFTGQKSFHKGIDMISPVNNAPIFSVFDGIVYSTPSDSEGGNMLIIKHENPSGGYIYSFYAHMATVTVIPGQIVKAGEIVGTEGGGKNDPNPGSSTGQHLHFEMRMTPSSQSHVNPIEFIGNFS